MEDYENGTVRNRHAKALIPVQQGREHEESNLGDRAAMSATAARPMWGDPRLRERGNGPMRAASMQGMQHTFGNRAVQRAIQRISSATSEADTQDDLAKQIDAKAGRGSRIDASIRSRLEEGLGADLSEVRVHTDGEADMLARSVDSLAFTTGQDIFFRAGMYDPHSPEGLRTLAHEATHTVQQSQGPVEGTPSQGNVSISDPSDSFEREAERAAESVLTGKRAELTQGPGVQSSADSGGVTGQRSAVQRMGWQRPTGPNEASPYLYFNENKVGGYDFGMGALGSNGDNPLNSDTLDILSMNGHLGAWGDEKDTRYGAQVNGGIANFHDNEKHGAVSALDVGVGTFGGEASAGTGGFTLGGGASAIAGALTFGRDGTDDTVVRVGGGLGPGGALRGYWGKDGANGNRKIGVGVDVGPFSGDIKGPADRQSDPENPYDYPYPPTMMPGFGDAITNAGSSALDMLTDW